MGGPGMFRQRGDAERGRAVGAGELLMSTELYSWMEEATEQLVWFAALLAATCRCGWEWALLV